MLSLLYIAADNNDSSVDIITVYPDKLQITGTPKVFN